MSAKASVLDRGGKSGVPVRRRWGMFSPALSLTIMLLLVLIAIAVFMTIEARGSWSFIIPFRGRKVLGMILVGTAIATSTVMFQTITNNRILTPSIMGFDALYMLIQTVMVFLFGSFTLITMNSNVLFIVQVLAMMVFAGGMFYLLFIVADRSLHMLVLVGIVLGLMLRNFTNLLQRMMDPVEFSVLQDMGFASFNAIPRDLLLVSSILLVLTLFVAWRMRFTLDILALGRDMAIGLGVNYRRNVMIILGLITTLVAISTALVGPITFFGLLVANLAYVLVRSYRHGVIIAAASLLAIIALLSGQMVLERLFSFDTSLSVIIEFVGGITFIILLLRGVVR